MKSRTDDDEPPGYATLLACDANSGCASSRGNVLVPRPLAVELNNIRIALGSDSPAAAFVRAAAPIPRRLLDKATRRRVLVAIGTMAAAQEQRSIGSDEDEQRLRDRAAALIAEPDAAEATEAEQECEPAKPVEVSQAPEPVEPEGSYADVVRLESFEPKLKKLAQLEMTTNRNSVEAVALRHLKELADGGPERLVKLIAGWKIALKELEREMPNFAHVLEGIARQCALSVETGTPLRIPPILLVGSPGVGKSHFAQRLAKALQLPSFLYSLESAETTSVLMGSEKHWSGSDPGELFRLVVEGTEANPVVVLDELDKAPSGSRGYYRPRDALIPLLERSTSENLRDKCSEIVFDGSFVIYVATANTLSGLERPILSRFDIQLVRDLTPQHAVGVVRSMHDNIRSELQLDHFGRPEQQLVQELALLANPRVIGRLLRQGFARAVERGTRSSTSRLTLDDLVPEVGDMPAHH